MARCWRDRRPRPLLPSGPQQGCPLRRRLLHRRHVHRYLLPPQLPRPHPQARERPLLRHRRLGPASRVPRLPALPARRHPGLPGMEHAGRRGGPSHAAHQRRHGGSGGSGRAGPPPRLQRPPTEPCDHGGGRHRATGHRAGPARPGGAHPPRDDRAPRGPRGLRRRVLQRPPVQRDGATDLRRYPSGVAGPREQGGAAEPPGGPDGCRDPRCATAPPLPTPVQPRVGVGLPRHSCRARGRRAGRGHLPAQHAAAPRVRRGRPRPRSIMGTTGLPSSTPTSIFRTCAT